jgi:hypothetical protein
MSRVLLPIPPPPERLFGQKPNSGRIRAAKTVWKVCKHWLGSTFDTTDLTAIRTNHGSIRVLLPGQEEALKTSVFKVFSKRSF